MRPGCLDAHDGIIAKQRGEQMCECSLPSVSREHAPLVARRRSDYGAAFDEIAQRERTNFRRRRYEIAERAADERRRRRSASCDCPCAGRSDSGRNWRRLGQEREENALFEYDSLQLLETSATWTEHFALTPVMKRRDLHFLGFPFVPPGLETQVERIEPFPRLHQPLTPSFVMPVRSSGEREIQS